MNKSLELSSKESRLLNMGFQLVMLLVGLGFYYLLRGFWNPVGFDPFSYWILTENGEFIQTLVKVALVPLITAVVLGTLSLLSTNYENPNPYWFDLISSAFAGIVEEVSYRGVFIYVSMAVLALVSGSLLWVIGLLMIGVAWYFDLFDDRKTAIKTLLVIAAVMALLYLLVGASPLLSLYEVVLIPFYSWIMTSSSAFAVVIGLVVLVGFHLGLGYLLRRFATEQVGYEWEQRNVLWGILRTIALGIFWFVLIQLIDPTAILNGPVLLSASIISTARWFRKGHEYQGSLGAFNSWVIAFYMQYVAFSFGLAYAMIVHALYNAVLYTGYHFGEWLRKEK